MNSPFKAIVTAGGTRQPIDDVRGIDNFSSGRFGIEIAKALSRQNVETTLLGSKRCLERAGTPNFETKSFITFEDLQSSLYEMLEGDTPSIIFMAAAVSDYSPIPQDGKIRSDEDELVIRMKKNPKILSSLREQAGIESFIVGFKLLSGVSDAELIETALRQVKSTRTNLCIANDMQKIDFEQGIHPLVMVTPEGGAIALDGSRREVADGIVDFALKRNDVHWFRTTVVPGFTPEGERTLRDAASDLLAMAQDARLLLDTSGNVSYRGEAQDGPLEFFVSPRQLDKSKIQAKDLSKATVDLENFEITSQGAHKSSIDTGMQGLLYHELPELESLLHFHPGQVLVLSDGEASFPYPCGTLEEANQVLDVLDAMKLKGSYSGGKFLVTLPNHGYLLGLEQGGAERIQQEWKQAKEGYAQHLNDIAEPGALDSLSISPIFVGPHIVGVIGEHEDGWSTIWLHPESRKKGDGYTLVNELIGRGVTVGTHQNCAIKDYYLERGYKEAEVSGKVSLLIPPSQRTDLRESATIAIVNPDTRKMLIGKRLTKTWQDHYSFPGGGKEEGESSFEAALRELKEETRIVLRRQRPVAESVHYTGWNSGERAYRVKNFIVFSRSKVTPQSTEEMEAAWHPIDADLKMGKATKAIVRQIKKLLP